MISDDRDLVAVRSGAPASAEPPKISIEGLPTISRLVGDMFRDGIERLLMAIDGDDILTE